jgi:membrane-anchored glycerophosphoryl diester phosphodiesterase (GDPDase)
MKRGCKMDRKNNENGGSKDAQAKHKTEKVIIRAFPKWVSTIIVIVALLEVVFIGALFGLFYFEKIDMRCVVTTAESSLLATGVAIMGIAIAVWAGLNIANAIERKEFESLKNRIKESTDNIEEYKVKLSDLDKRYSEIKSNESSTLFRTEKNRTV